jgi:hypothetical protein
LFQRAIVESYPMFGIGGPTQSLAQAEEGGAKYTATVGATALSDLRMIPSTDLVRTMGVNAVTFGLRPNVDGHVLPHDLPETIGAHRTNAAALMIGSNYDEGTELLPATTPDGLAALERRRFGAEGEAIAKLYSGVDNESATAAQDRMLADYVFAASTREAQAFAESGAPAYAYRFTGPPRDRTRSRSARSIRRSSPMCSGLKSPSTGLGPIATAHCPTRSSNTGRISPRPGIRTAPVCRSGRATGPRRMTSWPRRQDRSDAGLGPRAKGSVRCISGDAVVGLTFAAVATMAVMQRPIFSRSRRRRSSFRHSSKRR